jgi:hypothetical protein
MNFKLIIIIIYTYLLFNGFAQASVPTWDRPFGGTANDTAICVQQTSDGGFIIAGSTVSYSSGGSDAWLIKTDKEGKRLWDRPFGGTANDTAICVQQTSDGGFIIAGSTFSYSVGGSDVWVIKTDAAGNWEWDKPFGGANNDYGVSVQQTSNRGYSILGNTFSWGAGGSDVWLIKTDIMGTRIWDRTFGGRNDELAASVQETSDDGFIIGATSFTGDTGSDIWLIKTDSNGNKLLDRSFGGPENDSASSVSETSDGGYIIAGTTSSFGAGGSDVWLIKTDNKLNKVWDKTYGGKNDDSAASIAQTLDGGYVIAGTTSSYGEGYSDVWLIKVDNKGNWMWDKTFGGKNNDSGASVQETSGNEYILAGTTNSYSAGGSDAWLLRVLGDAPSPNDSKSPAGTPANARKTGGFEMIISLAGLLVVVIANKLKK